MEKFKVSLKNGVDIPVRALNDEHAKIVTEGWAGKGAVVGVTKDENDS